MVVIYYFSVLREKLGKNEESLEFEGTVAQLKEKLKLIHPEAGPILDRVKFAVNEEYVGEDFQVKKGDRIAIIPPVSGG